MVPTFQTGPEVWGREVPPPVTTWDLTGSEHQSHLPGSKPTLSQWLPSLISLQMFSYPRHSSSPLDTFIPKTLLCSHTSLFKFLKAGSPVYGHCPRRSVRAEKGGLWNEIDSTESNSSPVPLPLLCPLPPLPGFPDPSFSSSEPSSYGLLPRGSTVSTICRIPWSSLQLREFPLQSLPSRYPGPAGSQDLQL